MSTLRAGIAGIGRMGRRHAENLAWRVPGVSLVAACSPLGDELAWAKGTLKQATIRSSNGGAAVVRYRDSTANISLKPGEVATLNGVLQRTHPKP